MKDSLNLFEIIKPYNEIIIVGHVKPDGDAVASCLATAMYLKKLGKEAKVILEEYNTKYDLIPGKEFLFKESFDHISPEVFISLDCGSKDRFNLNTITLFEKAKVTINIDHHISNDSYGEYNFVYPNASSTSEIVYRIFENLAETDKDIAAALYAGIIYDSGGLRFRSTSQETMRVASNLMSTGINFTSIYSEMMFKRSLSEIRANQRSYENLILDFENKVSYTTITLDEMKELGISFNDLDGVAQQIINIEGIEVGTFIYEKEPNFFKLSLRSMFLDVNKIANKFGGGGHVNASGCSMKGTKEEVYNIISKEIISGLLELRGIN